MLSNRVIFLLSLLITIQSALTDESFFTSNDEKVFTSVVSLSATGNPFAIEKNILEQSFKTTYTDLLYSLCSFRSLANVALVNILNENGEILTANVDAADWNVDDIDFSLHFEMDMICYDCPEGDAQLFSVKNSVREGRRILQNEEHNCYWSNGNGNSSSSDLLDVSIVPSRDDFVREFNKAIAAEHQFERRLSKVREQQQGVVVSIKNSALAADDSETTLLRRVQSLSCPCSPKSFCTYTNVAASGFFKISDELFYNCTCKDGYSGPDGWRCTAIDECVEEYPCAPQEEGGFCVDTDPNDAEYPRYKCGCRDGFAADTNFPPDALHGIKHCKGTGNIAFTVKCSENEGLFPGVIVLNVTGNPDAALLQREKIEESVRIAYERSLTSLCVFRSLEDVTLTAILESDGKLTNISETAGNRRYLEEERVDIDDGRYLEEVIADDDDGLVFNFNLNFTLFFTLIMRCFGCPSDAQLFNDASRRELLFLQHRGLQQDDSCFCENNGTIIEEADDVNTGVPSTDAFLEEFNEVIVTEDVDSIKEVVTIKDTTVYTPSPTSSPTDDTSNTCLFDCVEETSDCVDGICVCKSGFFSPSGVGGFCKDIPECRNGQAKCADNTNCVELPGSFNCVCQPGYEGDGFSSCTDIDECSKGTDNCKVNEFCINSAGSFSCLLETIAPTISPTKSGLTPVPAPVLAPVPAPVPSSKKGKSEKK